MQHSPTEGRPLPELEADISQAPTSISAAPPEPGSFADAVAMILERLAAEPHAAATLLPGFLIVPAPMTPATRAALFLPRAMEKRRANNQERVHRVREAIADQLAQEPAMSDYNLAAALNAAGLRTYTGKRFTATRVRTLLNKMRRERSTNQAADRLPAI